MFEVKHISKQFHGEYALRDVSLSIGRGLNFLVGASGSGKTTLLNILTGMEQDYEGSAFYCGQDLKNLTVQEKCRYYNEQFGFVWQDFNLLEDHTVLENVMLPQHLKKQPDKRAALKVLRELRIEELANQKTGTLSGGQKQRVAIARELVKNPKVILADEPTSALDEKSAKIIMDVLRMIAKKRTVIVVTHDTSLIHAGDKVYELDKGKLISAPQVPDTDCGAVKPGVCYQISPKSVCALAWSGIKSKVSRSLSSVLALMISATLLLVTVSGAITGSGQEAFQKLYDTYGESILDVSVVGSFTSAGGTDGQKSDEPSADVDQNIDGLYDRYRNDSRISHIVFTQAYQDISVTVDGQTYKVESSSSVPHADKLVAGAMPMGEGKEIVIPKSFADRLGLSAEEVIGKNVKFSGSIYNWDSGKPVSKPVSIQAKIVGVMDTTVRYDYGDQIMSYTVDDAFFFSKSALDEMRTQAEITSGESNFVIRAKTPADMIAIKDELNAEGIVPLGRFELVEDMVRLNQQTTQQSGSAVVVIGVLAVVVDLAVALVTAMSRRRECAIFQVSGYGKAHLMSITGTEYFMLGVGSVVVFLCASPVLNLGTSTFWHVNLMTGKMLGVGVVLIFLAALISWLLTAGVASVVKASTILKTGEH
jgi:ABC-type lipoprotein export system ATPase subunit